MVSGSNIAIIVTLIFSVAFPFGMLIWWKKKTGENERPLSELMSELLSEKVIERFIDLCEYTLLLEEDNQGYIYKTRKPFAFLNKC